MLNHFKYRNNQKHGFHLVDPSPWPFFAAMCALMVTFGGVMYMHSYEGGFVLFKRGFLFLLLVLFCWWRDVVREATFEGQHTRVVQIGLRMGFLLFIVSEIMFFAAFFWAFFHSSFNPSPAIGGVWPPAYLVTLDPWAIPLSNTILLLTSGACITWCHNALLHGHHGETCSSLLYTCLMAALFTGFQIFEYEGALFSIGDGVYGSTFYMATGFHGFHVLIGTCFLGVCLDRLAHYQFSREHHFGFEAAAWYWHFVDVVWLFLFTTMYWWGS